MKKNESLPRVKLTSPRVKLIRPIMTTNEAAEYLRVSHQTLEIARHKGRGPQYSKMGRMVRYTKIDLDKWVDDHKRNNTID